MGSKGAEHDARGAEEGTYCPEGRHFIVSIEKAKEFEMVRVVVVRW